MDNIVGRSVGRALVAPPSLRPLGAPPVANLGFRFRRNLALPLSQGPDQVQAATLVALIALEKEACDG